MTMEEMIALCRRAPRSGWDWIGEPKLNDCGFWELALKASRSERLIAYVRDRQINSERDERETILDIRRAVELAKHGSDHA